MLLKVILIPWVLHRLIDRLFVRWDVETLINIPTTMLIGIGLVIFAFALATPIHTDLFDNGAVDNDDQLRRSRAG